MKIKEKVQNRLKMIHFKLMNRAIKLMKCHFMKQKMIPKK